MAVAPGSGPGRLSRRGLLAGAVSLGLAGCTGTPPAGSGDASSPATPTAPSTPGTTSRSTLTLWTGLTGSVATAFAQLIDRFNAETPRLRVVVRQRSWSELSTDLTEQVPAGRGPDLALLQAETVPTLAARRLLQPLDALDSASGYQPSAFAGPAWTAGQYRQQQYGLPFDLYPMGLFYNRTLLSRAGLDPARPPSTPDTYESALAALHAARIDGQCASAQPQAGGVSCLALLRQFGGQFLTDNGRTLGWTGEAALKALTWYGDLRGQGYAPKPATDAADRARFRRGQVALRWGFGPEIADYAATPGLSWGLAALPNVGGTAAVWTGSHQFALPGSQTVTADRTRACGAVIAWLLDHAVDWARATGLVPAQNTARESRDFRALADQSTLAGQLDRIVMLPAQAGIDDLADAWYGCVRQVVEGDRDPRTALNAATDRARRTLEVNLSRYG